MSEKHVISSVEDACTTACGRVLTEHLVGNLYRGIRYQVLIVLDPRLGGIEVTCKGCLKAARA